MVVFIANDERTGQSLSVFFDENEELNIEIRDFDRSVQSFVLDTEQIEEVLLFLQKKIK
jgi:hypothetical protein